VRSIPLATTASPSKTKNKPTARASVMIMMKSAAPLPAQHQRLRCSTLCSGMKAWTLLDYAAWRVPLRKQWHKSPTLMEERKRRMEAASASSIERLLGVTKRDSLHPRVRPHALFPQGFENLVRICEGVISHCFRVGRAIPKRIHRGK
jgi:hypothetical protein